MKTKQTLFFIIISVLFCQFVSAQEKGIKVQSVSKLPAKEQRWALIIGVDNYGLKGAVNDARALKNTLVKYAGFAENRIVLLTTDDASNMPTRRNILIELDKLTRSVKPNDFFLFAFSGHGKTVGDNAYLIPSDGQMTNNSKLLRDISIDVKNVREAIEEMRVKQVMMVIDACRDRIEGKGNESEPLTEAVTRGFSFGEANESIEAFVTLYATRRGEFAYEFFDEETRQYRGYFSRALEEGLSGNAANDKGEVTLAALVKYIEDVVPNRSYINEGKRQIPWRDSNNGYKENELVLALVNNKEANQRPTFISPAKSGEEVFWQTIENSNEIEDFESYLSKCKSKEFACIYKNTAELKLVRLKKAATPCMSEIQLIASKESIKAGEVVEITAFSYSESLKKLKLNYQWTIFDSSFGGEIIDGQGTSKIKIKSSDSPGNIYVDLELNDVEDRNMTCNKKSTITVKSEIFARQIDELLLTDSKCIYETRLDNIAVFARTNPNSKLLIVTYGNSDSNTMQVNLIKEYLINTLGFGESEIDFVNKNTEQTSKITIYLVSLGESVPLL